MTVTSREIELENCLRNFIAAAEEACGCGPSNLCEPCAMGLVDAITEAEALLDQDRK